jgi:hypothetical protein
MSLKLPKTLSISPNDEITLSKIKTKILKLMEKPKTNYNYLYNPRGGQLKKNHFYYKKLKN